MIKKRSNRLKFYILIGLVSCTALICTLSPDGKESEKALGKHIYSFTPETILDSLAQGNTDIFTPVLATPDPMASTSEATVHWGQNEFLRVAQAVHEQSWGEPLGSQNLFYVSFEMDCSDIERGTFREAFFKSYKIIQNGKDEKRIEHWIAIKPGNKLFDTEEIEYEPNFHIMKPIDLIKYQITADEGLKIAESSGGFEARKKVDNECEISVFSPTVSGVVWEVTYVHYPKNFVNTLFHVAIDPQTGQYNILKSTSK